MRVGVGGLVLHGVFAAQIGGVPVAAVQVVTGDGDVFGGAIFVGLEVLDLGEPAAGRLLSRLGCGDVWVGVGV